MGHGRERRRKKVRNRRPKVKTKQALLAVLVKRPYKWTTLKLLSKRSGVNVTTADEVMTALADHGVVSIQTCAQWEGGWRYRPLPKCWPSGARIRELVVAEAAELGVTNVPIDTLAKNVSNRILGFEAPNTVMRTVIAMLREGELNASAPRPSASVSVPLNTWLKRTAREQARAGMV